MAASHHQVPLTFIDARVDDGIATLTLNRPQAGNALNWAVFEQLRSAVRGAAEDPGVAAIVIAAAGNRFVSGADVGFFVRCVESGDIGRLVEFTRSAQDVFAAIADCPKPVVAAVQGAALGGGFELVLACHHVLATPRAAFSFPETALGIIPNSGGTYRTPRRIGAALTKWLIYTGHLLPPPKALALGLVDELVMPDELASAAQRAARTLAAQPRGTPRPAKAIPAEFSVWELLCGRSTVGELRTAPVPEDRAVAAALKGIAGRPRLGLEWSERLIDAALGTTLEQGATASLAAVPELYQNPEIRPLLEQAARQQRESRSAQK